MKKDYKVYLKDIVDAMNSIESFTEEMSYEEFEKDDKTVSAVLRKLEVIGEATKRVPEEIQSGHSSIPWSAMAKMRDKIIHFYQDVDYNIVWTAVQKRIPKDKKKIEAIIKET